MDNVLERPVTTYMHRTFVILDENTNVASAVQQMHLNKADVIIVSKDGAANGIVTDSDILDEVAMKGEDSDQVYLRSIMSTPLVTLSAKGTVKQALQLMRLNQVKRVPITDAAGVVGIVTQEMLANAVRTSVIERTFSKYRGFVREEYKPILANLGILLQFAGVLCRPCFPWRVFWRNLKCGWHILLCCRTIVLWFFPISYWRKGSDESETGIHLHSERIYHIESFWLDTLCVH